MYNNGIGWNSVCVCVCKITQCAAIYSLKKVQCTLNTFGL